MAKEKLDSPFGALYQRYLENGSPNTKGDLLNAGIGLPARRSDWWDIREMWSYPHYYTLVMMLGDGIGSYRNENGFECELSPGTFFFTFPNLKQYYAPANGEHWGELYVAFAGEVFDILGDQQFLMPEQPVWQLDHPDSWVERLKELLQAPVPPTPRQSVHRAVQFLNFLLEMQEEATPIQANASEADWFIKACHLLTGDLHHKVDPQQIARELGMSYRTFRLYFTRRAQMPPMTYRDQARIKAACDFLANNPKKSCNEIAFILGYTDIQHFSAHIKKHTGLSPNQYRKKYSGTVFS